MLVAVKAPRTDFKVEGKIPREVVTALRNLYGKGVCVLDPKDEETVNIFETDWYRRLEAKSTPGGNLRAYRENRGLTQEGLARKLGGGMLKQHISGMEHGRRAISKAVAKKLAKVFQTSVVRFI